MLGQESMTAARRIVGPRAQSVRGSWFSAYTKMVLREEAGKWKNVTFR